MRQDYDIEVSDMALSNRERTRRAIQDAAHRVAARCDEVHGGDASIVEMVEEKLGWDLDAREQEVAVRSFRVVWEGKR